MTTRPDFTDSFRIVFGLATVLAFLSAAPLVAQLPASMDRVSVRGVVTWQGEGPSNGYVVELNEPGGDTAQANLWFDGSFQIMMFGRPEGRYVLRVRNSLGAVVHEEFLHPTTTSDVSIDLGTQRRERPVDGVVSIDELRNKPPKRALREFARAKKAAQKGERQRAIGHLRKAIEIHPRFLQAHNSLGAMYLLQADYPQAAASFEEALRIKADSREATSNLGMALLGLGRYEESERLVRRALELDPTATKTRYALAMVLISRGEQKQEALQLLGDVASEIPVAHLHAAALLDSRADYRGAARELRAYLDSGEKGHRKEAELWMQQVELRFARP